MRWISNFTWLGGKYSFFCAAAFTGAVICKLSPENWYLWIIGFSIFFGWSRDTEAANNYWFRRNKK